MPVDKKNTPPGPGVDASGQSVRDPSRNVDALVDAAMTRQDDLRDLSATHNAELRNEEGRHVRELITMRAEIAELRARYDKELRDKEESRIDAIRAVDRQAVRETAEVQATQASTIATTLAQTAEAMRSQVAAVAQQSETARVAALEPIQKAIDDLRRAQYEQQGQKQQVVEGRGAADDMKPVIDAIAALTKAQAEVNGQHTQVREAKSDTSDSFQRYGVWVALAGFLYVLLHGLP